MDLLHRLTDKPDTPALITQEDRVWSRGRLLEAIERTSAGLRFGGVGPGDRVLLVLDDTPAFYAAFLGAMRIGAVPVPLNFLSRAEDFRYYAQDSEAAAIVVEASLAPRVLAELEGLELLRVVANGPAATGIRSLDHWLALPQTIPPMHAAAPDDEALWLYSSGSTGKPKGVVHRHASLQATVTAFAQGVLGMQEDDVVYSTTPLFHAYGLGNSLVFPLAVGARVVLSSGKPLTAKLLDRVRKHKPTLYFSVPALYAAVLADPASAQVDWSSVRFGVSAAEALPPETYRRFLETTGVQILDGIGSTEMLHIYCCNRGGAVAPGTSGTPVPGYTLSLVDDAGEAVEGAGSGELWVEGPSHLVRYHKLPERTAAKLQGERFATGDRYTRDAAGCYRYEGRVDDMLKIGGLWVSPVAIEARLMEHPAVHEVAVVGVEVEQRSRISAHLILCEGAQPGEALTQELQAWCKEGLQRYQYPHVVHFVPDLPRTSTGKIQRFKLRD